MNTILLSLALAALHPAATAATGITLKFEEFSMDVQLEEVWNEDGYFDRVHKDTIWVELGLVSEISGQVYYLNLPESVQEIHIFQNYETSLTLMDEGPHVDLVNWKHHVSDWRELPITDGQFRTVQYSDEDGSRFPQVTSEEIQEAVKAHLHEESNHWTELAETCISSNEYPCGVSISAINLRIELTNTEGRKTSRYVVFKVPMGC